MGREAGCCYYVHIPLSLLRKPRRKQAKDEVSWYQGTPKGCAVIVRQADCTVVELLVASAKVSPIAIGRVKLIENTLADDNDICDGEYVTLNI